MKGKEETTEAESAGATPAAAEQTVPVLTRFKRRELDEMKAETGATADATAVACFARKKLRKG